MTQARIPLTRRRVLEGAVELADEIGVEALTIRKLAERLDVKPMTIYHHLPSKEAILDGMVDLVFQEIDLPPEDLPWKEAVRLRCVSARTALNRHGWAAPLMESRMNPGPAALAHHDAVIACLRRGGFDWQMVAHAYAVLDSFVYGFAFEEANLPEHGEEALAEVAEIMAPMFEAYPNLLAFTLEHVMQPGYSFGRSFEFGLDLIIDGLAERAGGS